MNKKRIAAIAGLVLIGLFYAATLILAFIDSPLAKSCLMAALFGTIVAPAVSYGYMIFTGSFKGGLKNQEDPEEEQQP